jgi:hypothetical protein
MSITNVDGVLIVNPTLGGIVGEINLINYENLYDPENQSIDIPVFSGTTSILNNNLPYGDYTSLLAGLNGTVYALALATNGELYAGGSFGSAGGVSVNNIAKWDGSAWSAVGSGLDGTVYALIFDNAGVLYAGGSMQDNLSKWDGSTWSSLGAGLNGPVYALTFEGVENRIYFGGSFSSPYNNIGAWDKTNNTVLDCGGANGTVRALAWVFFEGALLYRNIVAGGDFTEIGSNNLTTSPYFARLYVPDTSAWSTVNANLNAPVYSIRSTTISTSQPGNGLLYLGGNFTSPVNRVGLFTTTPDSGTWTDFGTGVNNTVKAVTFDGNGNVYAGGDFTTADGNSANYIAKWDGSAWSTFGTGTNASVNALATVGDSLYIGGDFTQANGNDMDHVTEIENTSVLFGAVNVSVNSKFLYALFKNQKINIFVTNSGVAYTNGLLT